MKIIVLILVLVAVVGCEVDTASIDVGGTPLVISQSTPEAASGGAATAIPQPTNFAAPPVTPPAAPTPAAAQPIKRFRFCINPGTCFDEQAYELWGNWHAGGFSTLELQKIAIDPPASPWRIAVLYEPPTVERLGVALNYTPYGGHPATFAAELGSNACWRARNFVMLDGAGTINGTVRGAGPYKFMIVALFEGTKLPKLAPCDG